MRKILFRGKRIDNGKWIEGYYCPFNYGSLPCEAAIVPRPKDKWDEWEAIEVISKTVGQYTSLHDSNGKKIFEGDIIRYADLYDYNCYAESFYNHEAYDGIDFNDLWTISNVVYGINMGYPAFDLDKHNFESNALSELSESGDFYYEVIGNIYDNPELLNDINKS